MAEPLAVALPPVRPELFVEAEEEAVGEVTRELPWGERIANITAVRRTLLLIALALAWEYGAIWTDYSLMFPRFSDVCLALYEDIVSGPILGRTVTTIQVLILGYAAGLAFAAAFVLIAVSTRIGDDLLTTLTAMFNPLPSIALLPLSLLWFGLGTPSLIFVMIHSVLWAVALNTHTGFRSVSETMRMVGQNYGLRGTRFVVKILIPAAFPSILAGLKIGWAFAWRTLIAAELIFGVSSRSGGLGWYIFEKRNMLETAQVFAGLLTVILIGLAVDALIFRTIEARTVRRWGMQR